MKSSLLALFLVLGAAAPVSAQTTTLESLLESFSELPGLEARFREEKRIALLAVPVRSEGRIWFAHPDRLMRRVTSPEASAALIDEGRLRMRSGGRTQELSVDENPVLRGFVESFRAVLGGNRETLERFYRAALTPGEGDAWELRLTPRNEALAGFVREIRMRGHGVSIDEMTMIEVNGDQTHTEFFEIDAHRSYSASESRQLFRIP